MSTAAQTETLNIDYHARQLLIIALNTSTSKSEAADKLKASTKSVYRMIDYHNVKYYGGTYK